MVKWVMRNLLRGDYKLVAEWGVKPAPFSPSSFQEGVLRGNSRERVPKVSPFCLWLLYWDTVYILHSEGIFLSLLFQWWFCTKSKFRVSGRKHNFSWLYCWEDSPRKMKYEVTTPPTFQSHPISRCSLLSVIRGGSLWEGHKVAQPAGAKCDTECSFLSI